METENSETPNNPKEPQFLSPSSPHPTIHTTTWTSPLIHGQTKKNNGQKHPTQNKETSPIPSQTSQATHPIQSPPHPTAQTISVLQTTMEPSHSPHRHNKTKKPHIL